MMRSRLVPTLLLVGPLCACASDPKPPPAAPSGPVTNPAIQPQPKPAEPLPETVSKIKVDEKIRAVCGISRDEAHFAFDSARLRANDLGVFKKLASCFTVGPLAGRQMLLVGRADPRGGSEYNFILGDHRAQSVARALLDLDVKDSQIHTSSRGEMDAQGTDEASWAEDRRVNIKLYN